MYVCMYVQPLRPPIFDRQRLSPNFPWIFPAADPAVFRPRLASLRFPRPAEVSGLWLYQNQRAGRLKRTQNNCHSCVPVPVSASSLYIAAGLLFYCRFCCTLKIIHKIIELLEMCACPCACDLCMYVCVSCLYGGVQGPADKRWSRGKRDKRCSFGSTGNTR